MSGLLCLRNGAYMARHHKFVLLVPIGLALAIVRTRQSSALSRFYLSLADTTRSLPERISALQGNINRRHLARGLLNVAPESFYDNSLLYPAL
ncbi:MAG: hypothetical protein RMJ54_11815 [Roseiflexaceae bacterium]|nr:hypothetical protein [Roseiflexus sp.]MDW8148835.1 hypothetical protein [Roseiflexaceae bacterium]MDW8233459.1 hypothetical protein [Roseiflexaceae bacterium]